MILACLFNARLPEDSLRPMFLCRFNVRFAANVVKHSAGNAEL
jgi:hypothetical protein